LRRSIPPCNTVGRRVEVARCEKLSSVGTTRNIARRGRSAWQRARARGWAARLDLELRRRGGRLVLEGWDGLELDSVPRIRAVMAGAGDATLTLRIAPGVSLGRDVHIEVWAKGTNVLEIGEGAIVHDGVRLILRGGSISIGPRTTVRDYSVLKSEGELSIGADAQVSYHSLVHCRERVSLADRVIMAERVTVVDSEKDRDGSDRPTVDGPLRVAAVVLERNVFVAAGAVIGHGSRVGKNATIGANAVLTGGDYPAGWVIVGAPAAAVRSLADKSSP
jgi:acetyltransferase-like isoleucine patch superfamily enzyme